MPIKGMSPKQVMHTEMHKFKAGGLHSGSSTGPKVTNRKQAIAIGLSEARRAGKPGKDGPDPIERSVAAADVMLPHQNAGVHYDGGFVKYLPSAAQNIDRAPPKLGAYPAPAKNASGYHGHHRDGHLRNSGDPRAHRIGRK